MPELVAGSAMVAKRKIDDRRWLVVCAMAVMLVAAAACSTPTGQEVRAIDSTGETVKLTYDQESPDGEMQRGIVECDVEGDELKNCRRLNMEYR